eukprot:12539484-Alexandrium_andersonii.AAC.1
MSRTAVARIIEVILYKIKVAGPTNHRVFGMRLPIALGLCVPERVRTSGCACPSLEMSGWTVALPNMCSNDAPQITHAT